jgi:hypothetical protein
MLFFGTPHRGLRTYELEKVVNKSPREQDVNGILRDLQEDSEFLINHISHLFDIIQQLHKNGRKFVSFYETVDTPTVRMVCMFSLSKSEPHDHCSNYWIN